MVNIVDLAAAVLEFNHGADNLEDVLLAQRPHRILGLKAESRVHLHPADRRQVVAFGIEEQGLEQRLGGLQRRRLARPHDAVDVDQRFVAGGILVHRQRVADIGTDVDVIDGERRNLLDLGDVEGLQRRLGDLVAGLHIDLARLLVDQVDGYVATDQVLLENLLLLQPFLQ